MSFLFRNIYERGFMKKILALLLSFTLAFSFVSCGECEHVDEDGDGFCDKCDEELDGELSDEALLEHRTLKLPFPLRRVTISEYEDAVEKIDRFIDKNRGRTISFEDNAKMHVYSGIISRYELQKTCESFTEDIHVVRFGDIAIVTCPFELFLDYGNKIRARSLAKQTVIIQLACGKAGYLPTEKAERGSHYSAYVSSGFTGHEGGDLLVREALQNINEMFRK